MTNTKYIVEVYTNEEMVDQLRPDWDRLSVSCDHPNVFMTYAWFAAWYQFLCKQNRAGRTQPYIVVLRRNGIITGISPFVRCVVSRCGVSLRRLQFVMRSLEWDYNDFILGNNSDEQSAVVVDFLKHHQDEWSLIDLRSLRNEESAIEKVVSALTEARLPYRLYPEEELCPHMAIDGPWREIVGRRSSATRHRFSNLQSRLDKMAGEGLRIRIIENPQTEPCLLERMIEVEAQKRVGGIPSPPFLGLYKDIFSAVFSELGPLGWLSIVVMEMGDRLLAWHFLFRCDGKLWGYLTAYDNEYSNLSPGTMLIPSIVDYGFVRGCIEYDFLSGEEPYKIKWATGFRRTHRLLIWNRKWSSQFYALVYRKHRVHQPRSM